jgi:hypothetical protein
MSSSILPISPAQQNNQVNEEKAKFLQERSNDCFAKAAAIGVIGFTAATIMDCQKSRDERTPSIIPLCAMCFTMGSLLTFCTQGIKFQRDADRLTNP